MNPAIEKMLNRYDLSTSFGTHRALREIIQEICLVGIWRAKLFEKMAFYGGTALRILYGLDRFSEDMDFTLLAPEEKFSWEPFANTIESELHAYGFEMELKPKVKPFSSPIQSAFLKTNTLSAYINVGLSKALPKSFHPKSNLKIKVEVDTDPTVGFSTTIESLKAPIPIPILTISKPDLFASKLHAALFRAWKNRVKGRDWYDVIWYIRNDVPLNLQYFKKCLIKNVSYMEPEALTEKLVLEMVLEKLEKIDVKSAISDMANFINEPDFLKTWNKDYLATWIKKMQYLKS